MKDYTQHRFRRDGLTLVVRRFQAAPKAADGPTADAPAFVLVHGIGVSSRYFMRLARELAPHSTVFTVDMPGFGRSPKPHPRRQVSVEDLARLVGAYLNKAGVAGPVLVGHSMGTQIVTEMSLQDPALTDRIVLMGPVVDPAAPTVMGQALRLMRDVLAEPLIANWMVLTDYLRCGPRWYLTQLPVMLGYPMVERLARVSAAVLAIRGTVDPVAPAGWVDHIESVVTRCTRLDVAGSAHVVQHSGSAAVTLALLAHAGIPDPARNGTSES